MSLTAEIISIVIFIGDKTITTHYNEAILTLGICHSSQYFALCGGSKGNMAEYNFIFLLDCLTNCEAFQVADRNKVFPDHAGVQPGHPHNVTYMTSH